MSEITESEILPTGQCSFVEHSAFLEQGWIFETRVIHM
jgi:hypothetical protein